MAQRTQFPPLEEVTKPVLSTAEYCHYSNYAKQTAWLHACKENGPVRPVRIGGRLGSDFKVTARPAAAAPTMADCNDQNPMTR